jgi:DNA-binding MarR family transcriptional regulator
MRRQILSLQIDSRQEVITTETPAVEAQWDRVLALHGRVEQELTKALHRRHGLGLSEYRALRMLSGSPGHGLRIQDLAEAIGLNQSSVSRLAARLEEAGLTYRDLCEDDRRGVYSVITDDGIQRLRTAEPVYRETLVATLDAAEADPRFASVVHLLRQR